MKIKDGFILQKIADKYVAVSVCDDDDEPNVIITLNQTGAFVWELLQNDMKYDEVIKRITDTYDIDQQTAKEDFDRFLSETRKVKIIEE